MISDEPDEDADDLDDEALLSRYTGTNPPIRHTIPTVLPDWPSGTMGTTGIDLGPETTAWFQATQRDWRWAVGLVLRVWVATKTTQRQSAQTMSLAAPAPEANQRGEPL